MMRDLRLDHRFVKHIPEKLEPGVLFISVEYATAVHSCCCGCGEEIVTPLTPTDWKMTYDGETVTLYPSIGSWSLPCRSHYIINRGRVIEAAPWSDRQIATERARDRAAKAVHYGTAPAALNGGASPDDAPASPPIANDGGYLSRLWQKLRGLF